MANNKRLLEYVIYTQIMAYHGLPDPTSTRGAVFDVVIEEIEISKEQLNMFRLLTL